MIGYWKWKGLGVALRRVFCCLGVYVTYWIDMVESSFIQQEGFGTNQDLILHRLFTWMSSIRSEKVDSHCRFQGITILHLSLLLFDPLFHIWLFLCRKIQALVLKNSLFFCAVSNLYRWWCLWHLDHLFMARKLPFDLQLVGKDLHKAKIWRRVSRSSLLTSCLGSKTQGHHTWKINQL